MTGSEVPQRPPISAKINLAALAILACALWFICARVDPGSGPLARIPDAGDFRGPALPRPTLGAGGTLSPRTASLLAGGLGAAAILGLLVAGFLAATVDWSSQVVDFALAGSFALLGCGAVAAFADRRVAWVRFSWTTLRRRALAPLLAASPGDLLAPHDRAAALGVGQRDARPRDSGRRRAPAGQHHRVARGTVDRGGAQRGAQPRFLRLCGDSVLGGARSKALGPVRRHRPVRPPRARDEFPPVAPAHLARKRGRPRGGGVHDVTGYAVLVVTAAVLVGIAIALDRGEHPNSGAASKPQERDGREGRIVGAQAILGGVLSIRAAVLVFFAASTYSAPASTGPVPDLLSMVPSSAAGWSVRTTPDLYRFSGTLRTNPFRPTRLSPERRPRPRASHPLPGLLVRWTGVRGRRGLPHAGRLCPERAGSRRTCRAHRRAGRRQDAAALAQNHSSRARISPSMSGSGALQRTSER